MPVSDGDFYWESELGIVQIRRSDPSLEPILIWISGVIFDPLANRFRLIGLLTPKAKGGNVDQSVQHFIM